VPCLIAAPELSDRTDNLNYYKFGLGLGVASAMPPSGGKKGGAEATEAAAGGADQWVQHFTLLYALQEADTQVHHHRPRSIL
jgi:hypothetical protein